MPDRVQGDIFEVAQDTSDALVLVFGRIGLNAMNVRWRSFREHVDYPEWRKVRNPFVELGPMGPTRPTGSQNWFWFVHSDDNQGLSDDAATKHFQAASDWLTGKGIGALVTNGVKDADHGLSTASNSASNARRVQLLLRLAEEIEARGVRVVLVSLNDAFVRDA